MDFNRKKIRLGDVLVERGVITQEQLEQGLQLQKGSGRKLGETLIDEGFTTEEAIGRALSNQLGYDMIDLQNVAIPEDVLGLVPGNVLERYKVLPFEYASDLSLIHI